MHSNLGLGSNNEERGESCSMNLGLDSNLGLGSNNEERGESCSMNLGLDSKRK